MDNPFSGYGRIVQKPRFIGRADALDVLYSTVIGPAAPGKTMGNVAIVGEPRIGKSSLAYVGIMGAKDELLSKNTMPVWVNVASQASASELLMDMAAKTYKEFRTQEGWVTPEIDAVHERLGSDHYAHALIESFFRTVHESNRRVVFVLDEFDEARSWFANNESAVQGLRELAYHPDFGVTLVTTSRRRLSNIESQSTDISSFTGIFSQFYLKPFDASEKAIFMERFAQHDVILDEPSRRQFDFYCGGYPFLMDALGCQLFEQASHCSGRPSVDDAFAKTAVIFSEQYDHLIHLHQKDDTYDKLMQIVCGPVANVQSSDVAVLLSYGLIRLDELGHYVAFSEHFQSYLEAMERDVDYWPLWGSTEKSMRCLVDTLMTRNLGEDWEEKLAKSDQGFELMVDAWKSDRDRQIKSRPQSANRPLIEFSHPDQLFQVMFAKWSVFSDIFTGNKAGWATIKDHLAKIRPPLAHNREDDISDAEFQIAQGYCKKILQIIEEKEPGCVRRSGKQK